MRQEKSLHGSESARLLLTFKSPILSRESGYYITVKKWNRADFFTLSGEFVHTGARNFDTEILEHRFTIALIGIGRS